MRSLSALAFVCVASGFCQDAVYPARPGGGHPAIQSEVLVIHAQVVEEQWPHTTHLVNAPADIETLVPGQCVRLGLTATGTGRQDLLRSARIEVAFEVAGKRQEIDAAVPEVVKDLKPSGGDLVTQALGVAGIKNPVTSLMSVAVPAARWCVPSDLRDGKLTIQGKVVTTEGPVSLAPRSIELRSFDAVRRDTPFTTREELGRWMQGYHFAPDPARLLPAIRFTASDAAISAMPHAAVFFVAALRAAPLAATDMRDHLLTRKESPQFLTYATSLLRQAGQNVDPLMKNLDPGQIATVLSTIAPDPFDPTPNLELTSRLDMLWSVFIATGRIEPVHSVVRYLAWRPDYDEFKKMLDAGQQPTELTESVIRAVIYRAAGWSLNSLTLTDGLVTDYIDFIKASPSTPQDVKRELASLHTNPAFNMQNWGAPSSGGSTSAANQETQAEPEDRERIRVEFINPQRSHLTIEVRIGSNTCAENRILHTQLVKGDAGWVLTARVRDQDSVCYRTRKSGASVWGEWKSVERRPSDSPPETYTVSVQ